MLRKALSLKRFPYKSGCACSEKWGRPSTFALLFTRLGGHAPKSWTAAGLARAFFIRFYRFLGGYTPKKHWIFSRETGWSCSEFCTLILGVIALLNANKNRALQTVLSALAIILSFIAVAFARPRSGSTLSIDYLGIIVSILGIMTTILLGYQLYNAFKIKEEADKVKALAKKNQEQSNYLRKRIKFMEKAIAELKDKEPDLKWTEYEE